MTDLTNFDSEELLALANIDLRRDDFTAALEKLKVIKGRNEIPVELYSIIGRTYASLGLLPRAKSAFITYVEQVPNAIHEQFQIGMVEYDMGNVLKAQQLWSELLIKEENYAPALFYKAQIHLELDEHKEAIVLFNQIKATCSQEDQYFNQASEQLNRLNIQ